jgi:hypothetical protein
MGTSPNQQPASTSHVAHDRIAQRAYEKWIKRGRPVGDGVQDWVDAETELKAEHAKNPAAFAQQTMTPHAAPTQSAAPQRR